MQDEVLTLLLDLQQEHGFGCLFSSHDLAVVQSLSQRVTVMQHGNVTESVLFTKVLQRPETAYTRHLLASVSSPNPLVQKQRREARAEALSVQGP